jgi:hypothetical protein
MDIYAGATPGAAALGASVVKNMVQPLHGGGYFVFYDNFFSSVELAKDLLEKKVYTIGTTWVNRKKWPQCLKALKEMEKGMNRGDSKSVLSEDDQIVFGVEGQSLCPLHQCNLSTWTGGNCLTKIETWITTKREMFCISQTIQTIHGWS